MQIILYLIAFCSQIFAADDIGGFWKSMNDKTGIIQCVVAVYPYDDQYYGRIISTYDEKGKMKESIYDPIERAPGVVGKPYYCGLDLIWNLEESGAVYKGKILDPEKGNIYNAELWIDNGNLIVRGKLLFFGRNAIWLPASAADFPENFKMPDVSKFVPKIPEVN